MTRTPEQILCCPDWCVNHEEKCPGMAGKWADLLAMPPSDRLTFARALLPDGWVVAKVPEEKDISGGGHGNGYNLRAKMGWNACRAAMLASGEETT